MIKISTISSRLKQKMEDRGFNKASLSRKLKVHKTTVASWIDKNVQPSAYIAYQLSQVLQCDFQWLVTGTESKSDPAMVKELIAVYNINNKTDIKIESDGSTKLNDPIIGKILKELDKADPDDLERILKLIQLSLKIEKK